MKRIISGFAAPAAFPAVSALCAALALLLLAAAPPFQAQARAAAPAERPRRISPQELAEMLDLPTRRIHFGGTMIAAGDTVAGPLVVIRGSLDLQDGAAVRGDAWVVDGSLIMTGASLIDGNVHLVNSRDYRSHEASITSRVRRYECACRLDDERFEADGEVVFLRAVDQRAVRTRLGFGLGRPSRVDYEALRVGLLRENERHEHPYVRGYAYLHVPVWKPSGGHLGFDAGLQVPLAGEKLSLLVGGFKRTETNDAWMLSRLENGFLVVMGGDDFLDYWERRGGEAGLRYRPFVPLALTASVSLQDDVSLAARSIPALLRGTEVYRPNPAIADGRRLAVTAALLLDTRVDETWRQSAWHGELSFESGIDAGPGEMRYDAFRIWIARHTYLPWRLSLDVSGRVFSSLGPLPAQLLLSLGGYGGVRGCSDRPFPVERGDRLALLSVELRRRLPEPRALRWLLTRREVIIFSDLGLLDLAERQHAPFDFLGASFSSWRKTVGVGLAGESFAPYLGLYAAQDLDARRFDPRLILRFERSF